MSLTLKNQLPKSMTLYFEYISLVRAENELIFNRLEIE